MDKKMDGKYISQDENFEEYDTEKLTEKSKDKEFEKWTGVGNMGSRSFVEENKIKIILGVIAVVIVAFAAQHFYYMIQAKKQANEYEQMLEEAEHNTQNIIVTDNISVEKATIMEAMKDAKELVVYKYYYTDVGEYSKDRNFKLFQSKISVPFTTDKTLYTYTGTISAGVDLAKLDEDNFKINDEKEKITITLPKPKILYHVIDDKKFQTYNVNNSVFTNSDLKDYKDFERKLKSEQEEKLKENDEFWDEVRNNTKKAIKDLLTLSGQINDYTIDFEWE
ncbi:MAG: DUF4230 domain-containing protein [Lachnospiraceae bacterium]|nr:DUF4230 domain-containing protein [Lachnospiraceae bacterium]